MSGRTVLETPCLVEGCRNLCCVGFLCHSHYRQLRFHGDFLKPHERFLLENPPKDGIGLIPVGNRLAIVDEKNWAWLSKLRWSLFRGKSKTEVWYARQNGTGKYMHCLILGSKAGTVIDHENSDGLDNREENLRRCSHQESSFHTRPRPIKSSRYKGVTYRKDIGKWRARIRLNYKLIDLGTYWDEIDAARAYNTAAKQHYGRFAFLNDV